MKTELKDVIHLYLGCEVQTDSNPIQIEKLIGVEFGTNKGVLIIQTSWNGLTNYHREDEGIEYIKPILHPLSELMNEDSLESPKIESIVNELPGHCDAYDEWLNVFIESPDQFRLMQAPFELILELIKQQFDVFGLLESGQATNKTTLNTESK